MQNQFRHYIAVGENHGEPIWLSGALLRVKVSAEDTGGVFSLTEVLAPLGCTSPLHTDPTDETLHVLEGELRLAIGGEQRMAAMGDTLMIRRGVPHAVRVVSESARFLLMNGCHDRFFRLAGEPAIAGETPPACPPDHDRLRKAAEETGVAIFGSVPFRELPHLIPVDTPARHSSASLSSTMEIATS